MENNKFKKGIDEIKNIVMTNDEKKLVFENILKLSENTPKLKSIKSPWFTFSFMSIVNKKQLAYFVVIPLLFILTGGGVIFASESSLPDSILYPIKVKLVEPIQETLTFSPKNKAKYETKLATKRLDEAIILAKKGKLNQINESKINNLLDKHTIALDKAINIVKKKESKEQIDKIITDFSSEMNIHAEVLDIVNNKKDYNNIIKENIIKNIEKDNNKEFSNKKEDNQISKNARINADRINKVSKTQEDNTLNNKELKYNNGKDEGKDRNN